MKQPPVQAMQEAPAGGRPDAGNAEPKSDGIAVGFSGREASIDIRVNHFNVRLHHFHQLRSHQSRSSTLPVSSLLDCSYSSGGCICGSWQEKLTVPSRESLDGKDKANFAGGSARGGHRHGSSQGTCHQRDSRQAQHQSGCMEGLPENNNP